MNLDTILLALLDLGRELPDGLLALMSLDLALEPQDGLERLDVVHRLPLGGDNQGENATSIRMRRGGRVR